MESGLETIQESLETVQGVPAGEDTDSKNNDFSEGLRKRSLRQRPMAVKKSASLPKAKLEVQHRTIEEADSIVSRPRSEEKQDYEDNHGKRFANCVRKVIARNQMTSARASSVVRETQGHAALQHASSIWPFPFPAFKGIFNYDVMEDANDVDQSLHLGNGVYLWMLEIVHDTFELGEPEDSTKFPLQCQMRKTLVKLPDDACQEMRAQKDKYVEELWHGHAEISNKLFVLNRIDGEPVKSTIDFKLCPLTRQALAGEYEFELSDDDSFVKAIHTSWMKFANLSPDAASGFLFRIGEGSRICPTLRPPTTDTLEQRLHEAVDMLHRSRVWSTEDPLRYVFFCPTKYKIADISGVGGTFEAEVEIKMSWMLSRAEVFEYILHPFGWKPAWSPNSFEPLNAHDNDSVRVTRSAFSVKPSPYRGEDDRHRFDKEIRAEIVTCYRGVFEVELDLINFPFDVQHLDVKLDVVQEPGVRMEQQRIIDHKLERRLRKCWPNSEWHLLGIIFQSTGCIDGEKKLNNLQCGCRVYLGCRVLRHYRSYMLRIVAVCVLICLLANCMFILNAQDDLADMLGHSFMMLLTLTTYSMVVGETLPNLGYLTLLDGFMLVCFVQLSVVVLQVAVLGMMSDSDPESDPDGIQRLKRIFAVTDFVIVLLGTQAMILYVKFYVLPFEIRKSVTSPVDELDIAVGKHTESFGHDDSLDFGHAESQNSVA